MNEAARQECIELLAYMRDKHPRVIKAEAAMESGTATELDNLILLAEADKVMQLVDVSVNLASKVHA